MILNHQLCESLVYCRANLVNNCFIRLFAFMHAYQRENAWQNFEVLRLLLKERIDWGDSSPIFKITKETCIKGEKSPCSKQTSETIGPLEVHSGELYDRFIDVWNEEKRPLQTKKEQLIESFWESGFGHILNSTWERPHIKHVIMAYGKLNFILLYESITKRL